ncbi:hypothetical protein HW555_010218 [Spodoptera exigua]|uniref:Regulatory protein zeste n=1 Tax=Spodoptera exigua TaxID=7107 RepID=A0A835L006_SPOEX|nr:hypothetical protein HW555_010218 [Spodoptera exigua]
MEENRSSNFNKEETNKLMILLKDYPVITCKKTDHTSNKQKDAAWKLLCNKFNSDATVYRSVKQLQQKYNNLKKTARKEMAEEKYGRRLTGGGPPPPKPSETTEWLNSVMKESISGLTAVYDSDALDESNLMKENYTQDTSLAHVNLDFLDENTFAESFPHDIIDTTESVPVETVQSNRSENATNEVLTNAVKTGFSAKKRTSAFTPLETRKQIILHTQKKSELLSQKQKREIILSNYAQEEHEQNMQFKKEAHEQFLKHRDELHNLEMQQKKELHYLLLEKCKYETEKAKQELNNICK